MAVDWIAFILGVVVGLVLGNKTLRTKLGEFLRSATSKKRTVERGSPSVRVVPNAERLVDILSGGGAWSVDELVERTGLPRQTVVNELTRNRLFRPVGQGYWAYTEND